MLINFQSLFYFYFFIITIYTPALFDPPTPFSLYNNQNGRVLLLRPFARWENGGQKDWKVKASQCMSLG